MAPAINKMSSLTMCDEIVGISQNPPETNSNEKFHFHHC